MRLTSSPESWVDRRQPAPKPEAPSAPELLPEGADKAACQKAATELLDCYFQRSNKPQLSGSSSILVGDNSILIMPNFVAPNANADGADHMRRTMLGQLSTKIPSGTLKGQSIQIDGKQPLEELRLAINHFIGAVCAQVPDRP